MFTKRINRVSKKQHSNSYRKRMRIRRMRGGNSRCSSASASSVSDAVRSVSNGGDINTLINSNHLPIIPLSELGVSPLPAGVNTRDTFFGGRGGLKTGIHKKRYIGKEYKTKTTVRKIRFLKNRKDRYRDNRHGKKSKRRLRLIKGGGGGPPFFLPDDITNLKDSLIGGLTGAVNGYKGVDTPYQINHTYPYQQFPPEETYNSSPITDANAMYNNADNYVLPKY